MLCGVANQLTEAASAHQGAPWGVCIGGVLRWMGTDAVLPPLPKDLLARRASPKRPFPGAHERLVCWRLHLEIKVELV